MNKIYSRTALIISMLYERQNVELSFNLPSGTNRFFTGKERDAETGLDYFGFRYLSSAQGRWTSPDAPFADQDPEDPQSWNMYA